MSAYDDAVAYLDGEVHPRCDYDIYNNMKDIVDEMGAENAKLRELVHRMHRYMVGAIEHCGYDAQTTGYTMLGSRLEECEDAMRELGMELDG